MGMTKEQQARSTITKAAAPYTLGIDIGVASAAVAAAINGEIKALDGLIFGEASNSKSLEFRAALSAPSDEGSCNTHRPQKRGLPG